MPYYLYKLKFKTPVRFGVDKASSGLATTNFCANADTVFSAICNEWVSIHGEDTLKDLISMAEEGEFLISDMMPYKDIKDESGSITDCKIYIPKPVLNVRSERKENEATGDSIQKKKMKRITHIDVEKLESYVGFLKSGGDIDFAMDQGEIFYELQTTKVAKSYNEEPLPYQVASVKFHEDAGLCLIVKTDEDMKEYFDDVIDSLETTGLGGKRSSGYGKYELEEFGIELTDKEGDSLGLKKLYELLNAEGDSYISLSCMLPEKDDLEVVRDEQSFYQLVLRKGFVYSLSYADRSLKRKQVVMLRSGASLPMRIKGSIADTSSDGAHPVYRYGKGMFLGVKI